MTELEKLRTTAVDRRQTYYLAYEAYTAVAEVYEAVKDRYTAAHARVKGAQYDYQVAKAIFEHAESLEDK